MKPRSTEVLRIASLALAASGLFLASGAVSAQAPTLGPGFSSYTVTDLGSVADVALPYGGMTFEPGNPNVLLIGSSSDGSNSGSTIQAVQVVRNATTQQITGFATTSTFYANAPGTEPNTGIDAGLSAGPSNTLFYTSYDDNSIGEIPTGATGPALQVGLTNLGVTSSVGSLMFVPSGFAGAGDLKITSYGGNSWYSSTVSSAGGGTYNINNVTLEANLPNVATPPETVTGPEGISFVHGSSPGFGGVDTVLISEYQVNPSDPSDFNGSVGAYQIDANGDPIVSTRQTFLSNFPGVQSEAWDPVTGDLLIDTFGANDHVVLISGFAATVPSPPGLVTMLMGAAPILGFARGRRRRRS